MARAFRVPHSAPVSIFPETAIEWLETGLRFAEANWIWILTLLAFSCTIWNLRTIRRGLSSSSWPTAPGVIERSRVDSGYDTDHGTMYSASIAYHYTIDGKRYRGSTIQFGRKGLSVSWSSVENRLIETYPEGRCVDVHYKPSRPKVSTLKTGVNGSAWFALLICLALSGGLGFICARELLLQFTVPLGAG